MNGAIEPPVSAAAEGPWPKVRARAEATWLRIRYPVILFFFHRLTVLLVSGLSQYIAPQLDRPADISGFRAVDMLCIWDCGWYTSISREGYHTLQQAAFWPMFPWMARAVHWLTGLTHSHALILVSNLSALFALIVIHDIFQRIEGEEIARSGITLLVFWPFSFFMATGLAESSMIWLTALSIWLAMESKHVRGGFVLGIAILVRHLSVFAGLSLFVEQLRQRKGWKPMLGWGALGLTLPLAMTAIYPAVLWRAFHDPLAFVHARDFWGRWAYMTLVDHFTKFREPRIDATLVFVPVLAIGAGALLFRRRWWTLAAFAVPLTITVWVVNVASLGRYATSAWPAFLPLAVWLARKPMLEKPVLGLFAMTQAMFLYLFVHNYPIN